MKNVYEVIVGNVGTVHNGHNRKAAQKVYGEYRKHQNPGRAEGETVVLMVNGEPYKEGYVGGMK